MTYLLSLLTSEFSSTESPQILCYYMNNTNHAQIVRAMSGGKCHSEIVVFSGERILFQAFPDSYLEVYPLSIEGMILNKIDCNFLHINEKFDREKSPIA